MPTSRSNNWASHLCLLMKVLTSPAPRSTNTAEAKACSAVEEWCRLLDAAGRRLCISVSSVLVRQCGMVVRPCVYLKNAVKQRSSQSISANQSGLGEPVLPSTKGSTHRFDHHDESPVHDQC